MSDARTTEGCADWLRGFGWHATTVLSHVAVAVSPDLTAHVTPSSCGGYLIEIGSRSHLVLGHNELFRVLDGAS